MPQPLINALIYQHSHSGTCQQEPCFFQSLKSQFAGDRRKALEEVLQRLATLQVFKQGLNGYARASKDGLTVHNVGISDDHALHAPIVAQNWPLCGTMLAAKRGGVRKVILPIQFHYVKTTDEVAGLALEEKST